MASYILTCDRGFEFLLERELHTLDPGISTERYHNFQSRLLVKTDKPELLWKSRIAHNIIELVTEKFFFGENRFDQLKEWFSELPLERMEEAKTFRVSCQRYGQHEFQSIDVQRHLGSILHERFQIPANLEKPDLNVRVDWLGSLVFVGYQLNGQELFKTMERPFHHRAATKESLAVAMLMLSEMKDGDTMLDLTCGSGTIPITAAQLFPGSKCYGIDIQLKNIIGARKNAEANGVADRITFIDGDARGMHELIEEKTDCVFGNLPYGLKSGQKLNLRGLYELILRSLHKRITDDGRAVLASSRPTILRDTLLRIKLFKEVDEHVIESGGVNPHLFLIEKIV